MQLEVGACYVVESRAFELLHTSGDWLMLRDLVRGGIIWANPKLNSYWNNLRRV